MSKKVNTFYLLIGVLFVVMILVNTQYFKGSRAFLGVSYAKEYLINVEKPAIIEKTYVVPGQTVSAGDLLVELSSPELNLEIRRLQKEIEIGESQLQEKQKLLESEIQLLEAEKRIIENETLNSIQQIEQIIATSRAITQAETTPSHSISVPDSLSSLQLEIQSIREQGLLKLQAVDIKIRDLKQDHEFDQSQIRSMIELTRQEYEWKLNERENLNKYAAFAGVIEDVFVKPGEQVEAFSPLLAINPVHPSSVVGYLVGSKDRNRMLGEKVTIRSLEQPNLQTTGSIIGFGSVVELPEILQKSTAVKAFGLEIFIEISDENRLPIGEK